MRNRGILLDGRRGDRWPLAIAIALPLQLCAWFAYAMARGTEQGDVRPNAIVAFAGEFIR
ncbi:MAG TPA: hypothetical protein ENK19_10995 [Acidobacteria bacterium]|nr:hypothetical protein [Acidobacteriota bacterium]